MSQGIYISVPFCRSKCSFCNFASGVFPAERMGAYVEQVAHDIENAEAIAARLGARFERKIDSIYFGGGTPSLLGPEHMARIFDVLQSNFDTAEETETTVECAPNSVSDETLAAMLEAGVNRISFGAQSFVDRETSSVARLHKANDTVRDVKRIQRAGIANISLDLIAGLPHQTLESWDYSLQQVIDLGVPHVSVYMLEVDEDSRLGREVMAGGVRYHAHTVPDENVIIRMYERAIERLSAEGIAQYEISNFARSGSESRQNLKYWQRDSYFGFGADAHSMLPSSDPRYRDVRFATTEELADFELATDHYIGAVQRLAAADALGEAMMVGLRLNRGVDLAQLAQGYGEDPERIYERDLRDLVELGLVTHQGNVVKLTTRGRLLSNEVFERFLTSSNSQVET
jgi:oxygen-independent coproporphyrinogen-3 oxidase